MKIFLAQPSAFNGDGYLGDELVVGPRLGDVIVSAPLEGRARHIDRSVGGDQDYGKLRVAQTDLAQHVQAVAIRQAHIEKHQIERPVVELLQARLTGLGQRDRKFFRRQEGLESLADLEFVIDDENGSSRHVRLSSPRGIPARIDRKSVAWGKRVAL